ncbi:MAG: cytochrome c maturation protein CcmE [Chloroflexi bacterium]|nr:cytochrome c maturation protein CcmE [Chloroflexota bacterium]
MAGELEARAKAQAAVSPFLSGRAKLLIAAVLVVAALGYFAWTAFQRSTVFYYTVPELQARGAQLYDKQVRVTGMLVPDSFQREGTAPLAHFSLTDGQRQLPAEYNGVVPDLFFNPESEIVLQGAYTPSGVFRTDTIIVKCPSKYQSAPPQA